MNPMAFCSLPFPKSYKNHWFLLYANDRCDNYELVQVHQERQNCKHAILQSKCHVWWCRMILKDPLEQLLRALFYRWFFSGFLSYGEKLIEDRPIFQDNLETRCMRYKALNPAEKMEIVHKVKLCFFEGHLVVTWTCTNPSSSAPSPRSSPPVIGSLRYLYRLVRFDCRFRHFVFECLVVSRELLYYIVSWQISIKKEIDSNERLFGVLLGGFLGANYTFSGYSFIVGIQENESRKYFKLKKQNTPWTKSFHLVPQDLQ